MTEPLHPGLTEEAPAKVNLFLHVLRRRDDGYHQLDSLAVFAGAADVVTVAPADDLSLVLRGPFGTGLAAEADNLILRAARALAREAGVHAGARITLDKRLPVSSGIGGGSADAACALRLLAHLWGVTLPPEQMHRIALGLGADVPVCLASRAARMGGVGDILSPSPALPECGIALVNPGVGVSTPEVFRTLAGRFSAPAALPAEWGSASEMAADLAAFRNDLELPALALQPAIGTVLDALRARPGCLLARMSGSGATCFALFATAAEAERAAQDLHRPGWWSWGGALVRTDRSGVAEAIAAA
jgi:4-diphosphocytidyl-2-C-methyl-D-erythritol kinase